MNTQNNSEDTRILFSVIIDLADDFSCVETLIKHSGRTVRRHTRHQPNSLLTDAIRYMMSGHTEDVVVRFRGGVYTWRPGTYQLTLDAFRFLATLEDEELTAGSVVDVGCGSGVIGVGLALSSNVKSLELTDINPAVLPIAAENALQLPPTVYVETSSGNFAAPVSERVAQYDYRCQ